MPRAAKVEAISRSMMDDPMSHRLGREDQMRRRSRFAPHYEFTASWVKTVSKLVSVSLLATRSAATWVAGAGVSI